MFGASCAADEFEDEEVLDPAYVRPQQTTQNTAPTTPPPSTQQSAYFAASTTASVSHSSRVPVAAPATAAFTSTSPSSHLSRSQQPHAVHVTHPPVSEFIKLPTPIESAVMPVGGKGSGVFSHGESAFDDED